MKDTVDMRWNASILWLSVKEKLLKRNCKDDCELSTEEQVLFIVVYNANFVHNAPDCS